MIGVIFFMIIFPSTEKIDQQMMDPNKLNSPYPILLLNISGKFPLVMTIIAPARDNIMPVSLNAVNFSLNINIESRVITEGFKEVIIDARPAVIYFNPIKKKKPKPAIPVNPRQMINKICEKLIRGNLPYFLTTNIIRNTEPAKKRKKAEVKGDRFADIILPAI